MNRELNKTDPDFERRYERAKQSLEIEEEEEEAETEQEREQNHQPELIYDKYGNEEYYQHEPMPEYEGVSYEDTQSEQYDTNDYEDLIRATLAKAKKYKRKAKKLYRSLQNLKIEFKAQSHKIDKLEDENRELSSRISVFPNRIIREDFDPYVRELMKEIDFLKRENKRLGSYYLDTIEQSRHDTDNVMMIDQAREIDRLKSEIR